MAHSKTKFDHLWHDMIRLEDAYFSAQSEDPNRTGLELKLQLIFDTVSDAMTDIENNSRLS